MIYALKPLQTMALLFSPIEGPKKFERHKRLHVSLQIPKPCQIKKLTNT